jgi:hypothetical protein
MRPASARGATTSRIFGDKACHPERSEGSGSTDGEILRFAQDDSPDPSPVLFREALSPTSDGLQVLVQVQALLGDDHPMLKRATQQNDESL